LSPTTRRRLGAAAAVLLLALVLAAQPLAEVPRRLRFLASFAPRELAVRRLGGSGAAFDRRYFSFLENARRRLPPATRAVFLAGMPEDEAHLYLAAYQFAPLTVTFAGRDRPFAGSVVAVYGRQPGEREPVLALLPEGYLVLVAAP
jgi:hypothetical protein